MSNLFSVTIPDSAAALLVTYGAGALIRVQSSPTSGGAYGDIPQATVAIVSGQSTYGIYDADGVASDWYKYRYEAADGDPAGSYSAVFQPMAQVTVYASLADLRAFTRQTDDADDEILELALAAASRAVDRATYRTFSATLATAAARYFTPLPRYRATWWDRPKASIDDLMDDTGLIVAYDPDGLGTYSVTLAAADYALKPMGAPTLGEPWTHLVFRTYVPLREDSLEVTARWGWDAIPATIINATLLQASRFAKRRDAPFGIAGSPETGSEMRLLAKLDPDVALMVSAYRRQWGAV